MSTTRASGALHNVTPYLMYRDAAGGIAFCIAAFGAVEVMRHAAPAEGGGERIAHAQLRIGDSLLMLSQANPDDPEMPAIEDSRASPISLFLEVDDADATVAQAMAAGAVPVDPLADQEYGRSGSVRDPYGHHWCITSQPRVGAEAS